MHIEHTHHLGKAEAIRRINLFADELLRKELPAGVKVTDVTRNWTGDTMQFSFRGKKGFFGATISGVVEASDKLVTMDAELPGLLAAFVSEDQIRMELEGQMARVFAPG